MGVPAFYRWLSEKYPKIVTDVLEERVQTAGPDSSVRLPFDATKPVPDGFHCDNLYLDLNGIIHPASHPEDGPQPKTEEEMYENVAYAIDKLFRAIRPRQLLYIAIDGVAPRAKMNQQRARRFRAAQEARELQELEANIRSEIEKGGEKAPPIKKPWDSNVITPGTPFMLRLSEYMRFYIRKRLSENEAWKQIRVIFSDASIPGEGEHKIMEFVRLQRAQPRYDPNIVHVLHGLDADLIMLGLATHEAHFYVSREEVLFGRRSMEEKERRQNESGFALAQKALDEEAGAYALNLPENKGKPLQRISIPVLREYIANEFSSCLDPRRIPFPPSLERLIDDIVFLCFFVGNDFLPHLPSLDIRDGALDFLFNVYKRLLPGMGDYITKSGGNVNLGHVDVILAEVGAIEDYVFQMKHSNEERNKEMIQQAKERKKQGNDPRKGRVVEHSVKGRAARILEREQGGERKLGQSKDGEGKISHMKEEDNLKAAEALKSSLGLQKKEINDAIGSEDTNAGDTAMTEARASDPKNAKRKIEEVSSAVEEVVEAEDEFDDDDDNENDEDNEFKPKVEDTVELVDPAALKKFKERVKTAKQDQLDKYSREVKDNVRLHEAGWKDRYYKDKCKADDVSAHGGREHLFRSYVVGLCWVMKYYYDGCPSWKWYYPFHYAPFASDLKNIERFEVDCKSFDKSTPFNPVEQLMAVLPSDSALAIPKAARWLMTDPESPIIDFYPKDVPVDPNGKAMPWLWVVLLPFIEEERLLAAMSPTISQWTQEELLCNARGLDNGYLFVNRKHSLVSKLSNVLKPGATAKTSKTRINDATAYGCKGFVCSVRPPLGNELYSIEDRVTIDPPPTSHKIDRSEVDAIFGEGLKNDAVCVAYSDPPKFSHKSIVIPGTRAPSPILSQEDKRIRRPRINRGGGTIANMGMGQGRSDQAGFGSMNIGSYERDLAQRTGRGGEMYQAGTRTWGSFEPAPKRRNNPQHHFAPPQLPNPLLRNPGQVPYPPPGNGHHQHPSNWNSVPGHHFSQGNFHENPSVGVNRYGQASMHSHNQPPGSLPYQQRRGTEHHSHPNRPGAPQQQHFNFRNQLQQPSRGRGGNRVNPALMDSLRAQLNDTLQQTKREKR